jgi:amino acid adenylation domain-containing protein
VSSVKPNASDVPGKPAVTEANLDRLATWNAKEQAYSQETIVPELVARQAITHPQKIAVQAGNETVTYSDLDQRANQIARYLQSRGVGRNTLVAICLERSVNFVVGALGILKSGGVYVPVDPGYPVERITWMLNDAQPAVLLTQRDLAERLPQSKWETLNLDSNWPQIASFPAQSIDCIARPEDLAYVIYTSGSTGRPKGVKIAHDNLLNLVFWHQSTFKITSSDRASQIASPGFDAAVWEVWPYLTAGASLHVPEDGIRSDPESLRSWMVSGAISVAFAPTPLAERLIKLSWPREAKLRLLLTGADTLHSYPPRDLPFTLVNNYGPTECTVVATSGVVPADGGRETLPSIGRPISNVQVYILGDRLEKVPVGAPGEICIGGAGVGRGYLNAAELTSEKFVQNHFDPDSDERLYRTGDLGAYLPDGEIAFRGRMDEQVKIRGYRIEPNEIVTTLLKYPAVEASAVIAREDTAGDKQLVAYVVLRPETNLSDGVLREFLSGQLPDYMVPATFVRVASLPVNASGKVDCGLLPAPDQSNLLVDGTCVLPRTPVERRIAEIVAPLLDLEKVSVEDNFFMLGGHSLLGTQLIARTRQAFGVELSLRTLFKSPTVAALAEKVEQLLYARLEAMSEDQAAQFLQDMHL